MRPESDYSPETPIDSQSDGGEETQLIDNREEEPGSRMAQFREKLDAYRMRTRSQFAPIRETCPEAVEPGDDLHDLVGREDTVRPQATVEQEDPNADNAAEIDRFDIILPSYSEFTSLAPTETQTSRVNAPLAAGLAVAAVLTSGVALVDSTLPPQDELALAGPFSATVPKTGYADISTASIAEEPLPPLSRAPSYYLSASELRALLAERPVKCVVEAPMGAGAGEPDEIDFEALRLAGSVAEGCVETVSYEIRSSTLLREAPAPAGGRIEINAAYSIAGDALCHHTQGLSALVMGGEMPQERSQSLESLLNASYAKLGGQPICHRLQALGEAPEGPLFRADAFVDGSRVAERTDPRPFIMKRREMPATR